VTKHYEWLQAKNYWFVPVVTATSGALHPEDGRRRAARRRELPEVATDTRATMPAPRRNVLSTPDGGSAVQPPGLSYTAHWEALGCALCLLTAPGISGTGPVWGRGFRPGSHRPRARVPLVVWAWDLFVMRLPCCGLPAPAHPPIFRSAICDCLTVNGCFSRLARLLGIRSARGHSIHPRSLVSQLFPFDDL
jgi:hypothetical protein